MKHVLFFAVVSFSFIACRDLTSALEGQRSCKVGGQVYAHGATQVPDLTSCNTGTCEDGALTMVTEIHCPRPCPDGTVAAVRCAECGPVTAECPVVLHECVPSCANGESCNEGAQCID